MGKGIGKRAALYLRVSTGGQTMANQRRELTAAAKRHGWTIVAEFKDHGISGKNGREKRPGFKDLLDEVERKQFDQVAAWSVDRLGRSLQDLSAFLEELKAKNIDLYLHQQNVDTSTPAGRALFGMSSVFAEFERALLVERVKAGLARARAEGKKLGRPRKSAEVEAQIRTHLAEGIGILRTAKLVGVGAGTVQRVRREMKMMKPYRTRRRKSD
jgi:DNA invertase Pin-like site-specific DNA recombinase